MRVVILGCGRVGAELAMMLNKEGHEVALIDKTLDAFNRLGPEFLGKRVHGIGIDPDVLENAGIGKADAFAAVTNGDNTNIMSALIAKEQYGVPDVVVRIYDPTRTYIYRELGLNTICPTMIGAEQIYKLFLKGDTLRTHTVGDGLHHLVEIRAGDSILGRKVGEMGLSEDAFVAALLRGGKATAAVEGWVIERDDRLIVLCRPDQSSDIQAKLGQ